MPDFTPPRRPASYDKKVALVLQGGGALGSYQAGVYAALANSEYLPDWVAGISIGAINAALIAGNAPQDRVARLAQFWEEVTTPSLPFAEAILAGPLGGHFADHHRNVSSVGSLLSGAPGFFTPRLAHEWMWGGQPTSYYDTSSLKSTLERLVDFDRINAQEMRFSVGAVNVQTGVFTYFDNASMTIRPEHVMASGALPPGFPPIEIDGVHYWDGGLVSNTPLQYVLDCVPRCSRLAFQVDVFQARGRLPADLQQVQEREKDIRYSSRTRTGTDAFKMKHDVRHRLNVLLKRLPPELMDSDEARWLYNFSCITTMDIAQLIYRPEAPQGASKDYEFSRSTMEARWAQGFSDAATTLYGSPWLAPMPHELGVRVFDVMHDILVEREQSATQNGMGKGKAVAGARLAASKRP